MDSPHLRRQSPVPEIAGWTLIELLVGLVVSGLLVGIAFQAVVGHGRFARLQSDRIAIQQNARAAVDLIALELRGADPSGIVEARERSIGFVAPRAWGIVCMHQETRLAVLFPSPAVPALRTPDEWLAIPPVASSREWRFLPVTDRTLNASAREEAVQSCGSMVGVTVPDAGAGSQARMYHPREGGGEGGHLGLAAGEAGLEPGRPVHVYDAVRYDVATSTSPGFWMRRNSGPAMQMQPLVGPLVGPEGLWFGYLDELGEPIPTPVDPGDLERIRAVEVRLKLRGIAEASGGPVLDSARAMVFLRNAH